MRNENQKLEEECEDAVFQICCTRESYSVKCANQLEKYMSITTKKMTAEVKTNPAPNFDVPVITEEQRELFSDFEISSKNKEKHKDSKGDVKNIINRVEELKSILNQIERSSSSEVDRLLKE